MATLNYLMIFLFYSWSLLLVLLFLCFPEKSQALNISRSSLTGSLKNLNEAKFQDTNILTFSVQGEFFGTDKYTITFGLGSPKQEVSLVFNTASNLMWTRCGHNIVPALRQVLYFNPFASTTYQNISCNSTLCTNFFPKQDKCPSDRSLCIYTSKYDDQTVSDGFFSLDSLNMNDEFSHFLFFCLPYNPPQPSFSPNAGLLGLGRGDLSFSSQMVETYGKYFYYCLPSNSRYKGYLTFGKNNTRANNNNVEFTPLIASTVYPSYYFIRIISIAVGRIKLPIGDYESVFLKRGIMIDSGTSITRLPAEAYGPMRDEFMKQMGGLYKMVRPIGIFDTCYYSNSTSNIDDDAPTISFTFDGGVTIVLSASLIFHDVDPTVKCLAFANNTNPPSISIFGNTQQKTIEVVYDVARGQLGFRPNACR